MKTSALILNGALLASLCFMPSGIVPAAAQNAGLAAPKVKLETVNEGELRLDGKITALLGPGVWQVEAISWTSPRGVTTEFNEPKNKVVKVNAEALIHSRGETEPFDLKEVKLGTRVAVIGKNGADGTIEAREVILIEGSGSSKTVGTIIIHASTSALLRKGRAARDGGQTAQALNYYNQALASAQGTNDRAGQGLVLRDMGSIYTEMGQSEKAIDAYTRSAQVSQGIGDGEASAYNGLGLVYLRDRKYFAAIKALEKTDELGTNADPRARAIFLSNLATAYAGAKKRDEAYKTLKRVLPLQEATGQKDDATETLLSLAIYGATRETSNAREYLKQATPRIADVRDPMTRAGLMKMVGTAFVALGQKGDAQAQFEVTAKYLEENGHATEAQEIRALSQAYEKLGDNEIPDTEEAGADKDATA